MTAKWPAKIDLSNQIRFGTHRSGWGFALDALSPLHCAEGIIFNGFLDDAFGWHSEEHVRRHKIPYCSDWIGILHHPPCVSPPWYPSYSSPGSALNGPLMFASLPYCRGIFTLSKYLADWVRPMLPGIPIVPLLHPTEAPSIGWTYSRFLANPNPHVVQLGHHLRRMTSIYRLGDVGLSKLLLLTCDWAAHLLEREVQHLEISIDCVIDMSHSDVERRWRIPNDAYDELLAENVAFLDLYDTSANNAVIECMIRGTPLVVNRHPAVAEYLGEDYPLFYDILEEAAEKLRNRRLLRQGHLAILESPGRSHLSAQAWLDAFAGSMIYQNLSKPHPRFVSSSSHAPRIQWAIYGAGQTWQDVTRRLTKLIAGMPRRSILVDGATLIADSHAGSAKKLIVVWRHPHGAWRIEEVLEGRVLHLEPFYSEKA